jgi:phosphoserine phosphatase
MIRFDEVTLASNSNRNFSKLIVFDMDSTLIDAECIDELALAAGVADKVAQITDRTMRGELDYHLALLERVKLLKGLEITKAKEAVEKIELMPGAKELLEHVQSIGYKTAMLSGGFTLSSDRVAKLLNIDYVYANTLEVKNGYLTGVVSGPMTQNLSKEVAFEEIARKNGFLPEDCIVVGDGANDVCIFKRAGYSIAFNPKPILHQHADVIISKKDLRTLISVIDSLQ